MCIYVYMYIYICVYVCVYIYIYKYIYIHTHTDVYTAWGSARRRAKRPFRASSAERSRPPDVGSREQAYA